MLSEWNSCHGNEHNNNDDDDDNGNGNDEIDDKS